MKKGPLLSVVFAIQACFGQSDHLENEFKNPPDSARPGVYWYFMDGNLNGAEMAADLESMKEAGLGNLVFLEVNVGVPRGPVKFMSDAWQDLFAGAVRHAERLGIDITLGAGPGWTGSGGPWVKVEQSMQHLVFSEVEVRGPSEFDAVLPIPAQRSTTWHRMKHPFYQDVFLYAFPSRKPSIGDINEKALYERDPYSSKPGVKPYIPLKADYAKLDETKVINPDEIIDLTDRLQPGGRLKWKVPEGSWTILRMGRRSTGASTRPAPEPGVGFDHDKFDAAALDEHFKNYYGRLLAKIGERRGKNGWTTVHLDSWEMGAQNWTPQFRTEFTSRRGYDPKPFFPAFSGRVVKSVEVTERFLWDVRMTAQELVLQNYAGHLKKLGHKHGFELSIEPYDMNPTADLDLGAVADVPMCEFWSEGYGFNTSFSCMESTSIAHTMGRPIVSAEAFTANSREKWRQYPWSMKNQGDWAFCIGVNRFVYHTFAHKPLGEEHRPGMTMGPYGVHWDRGQTWWPLVKDYHLYVSRCSHMLRQGVTVSDILYLTPEGAPHIFRPPADATEGSEFMPDKKGYSFDGCSPRILLARAAVRDEKIVFPGGSSYRLLVLPHVATMTPELLSGIERLVKAGAVLAGTPPVKSPSLSGYPGCDGNVKSIAEELWGSLEAPPEITKRTYGRGVIWWGGELSRSPGTGSDKTPDLLLNSKWIWHPDEDAMRAPPARRHFHRAVTLKRNKVLKSARAALTADNAFTLWINGKAAEEGDNFTIVKRKSILQFIKPGPNVLAVSVTNAGSEDNPAGLIAEFEFVYTDGSIERITTDGSWLAVGSMAEEWKPAKVLGAYSMRPWRLGAVKKELPRLFPSYDTTSVLLEKIGVEEDFEASGPVRYTHRRTEKRDIYFVSNRSGEPLETNCTFRTGKGRPELWYPVTGGRRLLPQYKKGNGLTTVPMAFAAYESFFVVFPRDDVSEGGKVKGINFPRAKPVLTLAGEWEVSFDSKWGGPEKVTFTTLEDWTERAERGIKYYSGIAVYRKSFDLSAASVAGSRTMYLDLGKVHDIASVTLNGRNLGAVWCAPWRVEISGMIKAGKNSLEIHVANRWANRMIGDSKAPDAGVRTLRWPSGLLGGKSYKAGRFTFSTVSGYHQLLPSGLIGPVRVLLEE